MKRGTFTYDGLVQCGVEILKTDFRPRSGEHEYSAEWRDDAFGTFYEIRYQSAGGDGRFSSGVHGFESVEAAMRHVEAAVIGIRWL